MQKATRNAAPQAVIHEEDLAIAKRMMNDPDFAMEYFLTGREIKDTAFACSKVVKHVYSDLDKCTEADIRTLMFLYFCCDGNIRRLESYQGTGKLTKWVQTSVMHYVFKTYDDMGYHRPRKVTTGNSKLAVARLHPKTKAYIVDLIDVPALHEVLWLHYVEGKTIDQISEEIDLPQEFCIILLGLAKRSLHLSIIATEDEELMYLALSTKVRRPHVDVTTAVIPDPGDETSPVTQSFRKALKALYGIDHDSPEYYFRLQNLVLECAEKTKPDGKRCKNWERDHEIWLKRYVDNEPAKDLAEKYGIDSAYIDVIKSRFEARVKNYLHKIFEDYIDE